MRNATEPAFDPIWQCIVVDALFSDLSSIDPFFETNFARICEIIRDSDVDPLTNWMDVEARDIQSQRGKARLAMGRLDDRRAEIETLLKKIPLDRRQFEDELKRFKPRFDWVAVLIRAEGKWILKPDFAGTESGGLFILRQNTDNTTVRPIEIGTVSSGKVELQNDEREFIQYMPVFFVRHEAETR
jgi:hypothetical protein